MCWKVIREPRLLDVADSCLEPCSTKVLLSLRHCISFYLTFINSCLRGEAHRHKTSHCGTGCCNCASFLTWRFVQLFGDSDIAWSKRLNLSVEWWLTGALPEQLHQFHGNARLVAGFLHCLCCLALMTEPKLNKKQNKKRFRPNLLHWGRCCLCDCVHVCIHQCLFFCVYM